jgi:hypothetical protein
MHFPFLKEMNEEDATLEAFFNVMKETSANPGIPMLCKKDILIQEFARSMVKWTNKELKTLTMRGPR